MRPRRPYGDPVGSGGPAPHRAPGTGPGRDRLLFSTGRRRLRRKPADDRRRSALPRTRTFDRMFALDRYSGLDAGRDRTPRRPFFASSDRFRHRADRHGRPRRDARRPRVDPIVGAAPADDAAPDDFEPRSSRRRIRSSLTVGSLHAGTYVQRYSRPRPTAGTVRALSHAIRKELPARIELC